MNIEIFRPRSLVPTSVIDPALTNNGQN